MRCPPPAGFVSPKPIPSPASPPHLATHAQQNVPAPSPRARGARRAGSSRRPALARRGKGKGQASFELAANLTKKENRTIRKSESMIQYYMARCPARGWKESQQFADAEALKDNIKAIGARRPRRLCPTDLRRRGRLAPSCSPLLLRPRALTSRPLPSLRARRGQGAIPMGGRPHVVEEEYEVLSSSPTAWDGPSTPPRSTSRVVSEAPLTSRRDRPDGPALLTYSPPAWRNAAAEARETLEPARAPPRRDLYTLNRRAACLSSVLRPSHRRVHPWFRSLVSVPRLSHSSNTQASTSQRLVFSPRRRELAV